MALTSFTSGVNTQFSSELNSNFYGNKIQVIETSTGYDSSQTGGAGTDTGQLELTEIASSDIGGADYVVIEVNAYLDNKSSGVFDGVTSLQIEIKEIGGGYGDTLPETVLRGVYGANASQYPDQIIGLITYRHLHTLTAGEKSNGFQIRMNSKCVTGDGVSRAQFFNKSTIVHTLIV